MVGADDLDPITFYGWAERPDTTSNPKERTPMADTRTELLKDLEEARRERDEARTSRDAYFARLVGSEAENAALRAKCYYLGKNLNTSTIVRTWNELEAMGAPEA